MDDRRKKEILEIERGSTIAFCGDLAVEEALYLSQDRLRNE
jgi:hypothetical protein